MDNAPAVVLLRPRRLLGGGGPAGLWWPQSFAPDPVKSVYACLEEEQPCFLKHGSGMGIEKWQRRKELVKREEKYAAWSGQG